MKNSLALAILVACCCLVSVSAFTLSITVKYPETNLDSGDKLFIRGDSLGLSWDSGAVVPYVGTDSWKISLTFDRTAAGHTLQFKILVNDEVWAIGANDAVVLSAADIDATSTPFFASTEGAYFVINDIFSPQLNNTRDVVVYTPPSYHENKYKRYDLLVMHDGQNLFNDSTSFLGQAWRCQDTVNALVVSGHMREIVIVGYASARN